MPIFWRILLGGVLQIVCATASAAGLVLETGRVSYPLGTSVEVLEDASKKLTIEDITDPAVPLAFRPHHRQKLDFGTTASAYWLRIVLINEIAARGPWLLELAFPPMDRIELYLAGPRRYQAKKTTGDLFSYGTRDIPNRNFVFRLPEPLPAELVIYLRVETESSMSIPLTLWRMDAFMQKEDSARQGLGIFYGVIIAILLYNLCLYFSIKEPVYLYFVLYLSAMLLFQMSLHGVAAQYLWPGWPTWASISVLFFTALTNLFGVQFTRALLQTYSTAPVLDRVLSILGWIAGGLAIGVLLFSYSVVRFPILFFSTIVVSTIFATILITFRRGSRPARFALLSYGFLFPGVVLLLLRHLDLVKSGILTDHAVAFGTASSTILLSFALAYRISTLTREKEKAQLEAITLREAALTVQQDFSKRLIKSHETERKRVATELHDGIGQNLMVIINQLKKHLGARPEKDASNRGLEQVVELASQSIHEAREIAYNLHPHLLDRLGLKKAIESAINRGLRDTGIKYAYHIDQIDDLLQKEIEIHIYRIVQEGVNNIVKHSRASECHIDLVLEKDILDIKICDNGIGGAKDGVIRKASIPGLGLAGIAERAKIMGGRFDILSSEDDGTTLKIRIPVRSGDV